MAFDLLLHSDGSGNPTGLTPTWVPGVAALHHKWFPGDFRTTLASSQLGSKLRTSAALFYIKPVTLPSGTDSYILFNGNLFEGDPDTGGDGDTPNGQLLNSGAFYVSVGGAGVASSVTIAAGEEATFGYVHTPTTLTVYVNGVACGSAAATLGIDWVSPPIFWVGCSHGNFTSGKTDEHIGDFMLWDGGLTPVVGTDLPSAAQMLANHQVLKATLYAGLP
jgi:hypothetical protein